PAQPRITHLNPGPRTPPRTNPGRPPAPHPHKGVLTMPAWSTSTRRRRLPPNWSAIRARILARDGGQCTWIEHGQRCTSTGTDVDHIRPGDDHDNPNLRTLCQAHHKAKSSSEGGRASARKRAKRPREPEPHPGLIKRN